MHFGITGTTRRTCHTRSIQQGISTHTHTKHFHNIQQQNNNYPKTYCKLFYQTIHKHCQTRNTQHTTRNREHINRETHTIQGYNITLTTTQVQEAIKQSKITRS